MHIYVNNKCQQGSVIIIGLLTLALLSLLGLASTTKSQTDISIAGNSRDIEMSLYSSESALVHGESSLDDLDEYKKLDGTNVVGHFDIGNLRKEDYNVVKNSEVDIANEHIEIPGSSGSGGSGNLLNKKYL